MLSLRSLGFLLAVACLQWVNSANAMTQIRAVEQKEVTGRVVSVTNHSLELQTPSGERLEVFFQDRDVEAITLGGDRAMIKAPAKIEVAGELPIRLLRTGLAIEVTADLAEGGAVKDVRDIKLLPVDFDKFDVTFYGVSSTGKEDFQPAKCTGLIVKLAGGKIYLKVPKSKQVPKGGLIFPATVDSVFSILDDSMHEVAVGDDVIKSDILKFNTGVWLARELKIRLGSGKRSVQSDPDDELQLKYRHLDNSPVDPREVRSKHFVMKTDLSERSSQILLDKLERMYKIVGAYYNRQDLGQPIYCYVVEDLSRWKPIIAELTPGMESITTKAGVTVASRLGNLRRAMVYSCGDHDVVQHEAVHAFCHLGFGDTGPTWYAEGMAELGCYWRPGDVGVNIDPVVIRYLTTATPTPLVEIVAPGQLTGDSWRAYAWRWALCYMLVNNANYSKRFYALGDALMRPNSSASFYLEFADVAPNISFEYLQFVKELGNGYQQELCSWDWKTKAVGLDTGRIAKCEVQAQRGWQATSAKLKASVDYDIVATGEWTIDGTAKLDPNGSPDGQGRLIGAILVEKINATTNQVEFELSKPFDLGKRTSFQASEDGHLYVRCQESMTRLGDNAGKLKVAVKEK